MPTTKEFISAINLNFKGVKMRTIIYTILFVMLMFMSCSKAPEQVDIIGAFAEVDEEVSDDSEEPDETLDTSEPDDSEEPDETLDTSEPDDSEEPDETLDTSELDDSEEPDEEVIAVCGDGNKVLDEECDDGNADTEVCEYGLESCTVCNSECKEIAGATSFCGDGVKQSVEGCDDGNTDTEACEYDEEFCTVCSSECEEVAGEISFCGDGVKQSVEGCDDENTDTEACEYGLESCTVCNSECKEVAGATSFCGDTIQQSNEGCDIGRFCSGNYTTACQSDSDCSVAGGVCQTTSKDLCNYSCVAYNIVPTNQTGCYSDSAELTCPAKGESFYGQDAQYSDATRDFIVIAENGEDKMFDTITGLRWQRTLPEKYPSCTGGDEAGEKCSWQEAVDYCDSLSYDGFDDWRLPEVNELGTLVNYGSHDPAVDSEAFPETSPSPFWTSTVFAGDANSSWSIDFSDGNLRQGYSKSEFYSVRCVRGNEYQHNDVYTVSGVAGTEVVAASETGVMWTKEVVSGKTWSQALPYCENLNYGGFRDWRLPNINELKTLIDTSTYDPASVIPDTVMGLFWSSTTDYSYHNFACAVNFYFGNGITFRKNEQANIICIR